MKSILISNLQSHKSWITSTALTCDDQFGEKSCHNMNRQTDDLFRSKIDGNTIL